MDGESWRRVAAALPQPVPRERAALEQVLRSLAPALAGVPLPRTGRTGERWRVLRGLGGTDFVLTRLAEGHLDALAILAEAGGQPAADALYGVWASTSGRAGLQARPTDGGWVLDGYLRYCSGATLLDRALVTARSAEGVRLFDVAVRTPAVRVDEAPWTHTTAGHVDGHPDADHLAGALTLRHLAEQAAEDVAARVTRATGPTPLVREHEYAEHLADLAVYVRQHGSERELERLGRRLLEQP